MDQNASALCLQLQDLQQQSVQLRAELAALPSHDTRRAPIIRALAALHRRYARLARKRAANRPTSLILERVVGA